jgi:hypothetical protein
MRTLQTLPSNSFVVGDLLRRFKELFKRGVPQELGQAGHVDTVGANRSFQDGVKSI